MNARRDPVERVLDVVVYVPIGAAAAVGGFVRSVAERMPTAPVDALRRLAPPGLGRIRHVAPPEAGIGPRALRDRVCAAVAMARGAIAASAAPDEPISAEPQPGGDLRVDDPVVDVPHVGELAIEGYDHLAARQVVDRLDGLTTVELGAVERYEAAHRRRRTVLGKIEQLRS